jgi:hypothetical protein
MPEAPEQPARKPQERGRRRKKQQWKRVACDLLLNPNGHPEAVLVCVCRGLWFWSLIPDDIHAGYASSREQAKGKTQAELDRLNGNILTGQHV